MCEPEMLNNLNIWAYEELVYVLNAVDSGL